MKDYSIKVFCKAKYSKKFLVETFLTWEDFLFFYDCNKNTYYFKICETYVEEKTIKGEKRNITICNTIFNCGLFSQVTHKWQHFFEVCKNPDFDRKVLKVFRRIRLDYLPSEILYTYERLKLFI